MHVIQQRIVSECMYKPGTGMYYLLAFRISNEAGKQRKAGKVPQVSNMEVGARAISEKDKIKSTLFFMLQSKPVFCLKFFSALRGLSHRRGHVLRSFVT